METFAGIVRRHARERREAPALTFTGRARRLGHLDEASSRLANVLISREVRAEDRVAVLSKNRA